MKVLIIGSKGFIGSACHSYFQHAQHCEVHGADVVAEYNDPNYYVIDGSNSDFKEIFKSQKFDWCINCAGAASVPDSFVNPARDYLLNVHLVMLLLTAIKENNSSCKFIQLSSAAVYGNPSPLPVKETAALEPLSPYGIHKRHAEELCELYHNFFGINIFILRIFSAYGPGLKKQLFWDLFKKSQINGDISLLGTGKETREFIFVSDIAAAIDTLINSAPTGFKIINIANSAAICIEEAAKTLLTNLNFKGNLTFNGVVRRGDPLHWHADTSLLKDLGYKQNIGFEEGINLYCKWLKERE
ncbi:SDR family oxidoreductase [Flavihumibacter sp. R14]|nr:SDR family oxidoreductase [Flavihumibacter soli]